MTNPEFDASAPTAPTAPEPEGDLASLRGDGARMAPRWAVPDRNTAAPVSPSLIHGVTVPPASARLLDAMSEYGD